jgi:N-acetylmuramoyl-L-alanine amidase
MAREIWIDAGHGGEDSGATYGGIREADVVLVLSLAIADRLKKRGHVVGMTRREKGVVKVQNSERARLANAFGDAAFDDVFVSIHLNASANPDASGTEAIYCPGSKGGAKLGASIIAEIMKVAPWMKNRGVKSDADLNRGFQLVILHKTDMPAVIIEICFVSNARERAWITSHDGQLAAVEAIVRGIENFVGKVK